ncbi:maleylacetoacetate isomerase [Sphingosinicellaceae bacterium]|nr:maleylacetoacetate isomerase [Sphingosinicellaceae bacterium]
MNSIANDGTEASDRILYDYWRSSAAYRVRIALNVKGLAYTSKPVDLRTGAQSGVGYTMLNPQGLIPFLIDGETGIAQSLAIIEWLEETYPEPQLLPGDAAMRARIRGAALGIIADLHPLNNLRVRKYLAAEMGHDEARIDDWGRHWMETGLAPLEEQAERATGLYLFGDTPTLADVCLVPQLYNARRAQADVARFPALGEIDKRLNALPAFQAARPERQPGADS